MLNLPLVCCKFQSSMKRSQGTIDLTLTKAKGKEKKKSDVYSYKNQIIQQILKEHIQFST